MIVDHLLKFASPEAAHTVLDPLGIGFAAWEDPDMGPVPAGWGLNVLVQDLITGWEPFQFVDDWGSIVMMTRPIKQPGYFMTVVGRNLLPDVMALPECILVTDRDIGTWPDRTRTDWIIQTSLTEAELDSGWRLSPMFTGTMDYYPFANPPSMAALAAEEEPTPAVE